MILVPSAATKLFFSNVVMLSGIDMLGVKSFTAVKLALPYSLTDEDEKRSNENL